MVFGLVFIMSPTDLGGRFSNFISNNVMSFLFFYQVVKQGRKSRGLEETEKLADT